MMESRVCKSRSIELVDDEAHYFLGGCQARMQKQIEEKLKQKAVIQVRLDLTGSAIEALLVAYGDLWNSSRFRAVTVA
jgi:hypothetical protein